MQLSRAVLACVVAVVAACGGDKDEEETRLEAEVQRMQGEMAELRKELAYQEAKRRGDPVEAPLPALSTDCEGYRLMAEAYLRCEKISPAAKLETRRFLDALKPPGDVTQCKLESIKVMRGTSEIGCVLGEHGS